MESSKVTMARKEEGGRGERAEGSRCDSLHGGDTQYPAAVLSKWLV